MIGLDLATPALGPAVHWCRRMAAAPVIGALRDVAHKADERLGRRLCAPCRLPLKPQRDVKIRRLRHLPRGGNRTPLVI
jgi:hypothetical protein